MSNLSDIHRSLMELHNTILVWSRTEAQDRLISEEEHAELAQRMKLIKEKLANTEIEPTFCKWIEAGLRFFEEGRKIGYVKDLIKIASRIRWIADDILQVNEVTADDGKGVTVTDLERVIWGESDVDIVEETMQLLNSQKESDSWQILTNPNFKNIHPFNLSLIMNKALDVDNAYIVSAILSHCNFIWLTPHQVSICLAKAIKKFHFGAIELLLKHRSYQMINHSDLALCISVAIRRGNSAVTVKLLSHPSKNDLDQEDLKFIYQAGLLVSNEFIQSFCKHHPNFNSDIVAKKIA